MDNLDTSSISTKNSRIFFDSSVLSNEEIKARLQKELYSLGSLVEPNFVKQISEGKETTFDKIFYYDIAVPCDAVSRFNYKYTKLETWEDGTYKVYETIDGNIKIDPNKRTTFTEYKGVHEYEHHKTLKGVRCLLYPAGKQNEIIGLNDKELAWSGDYISSQLKPVPVGYEDFFARSKSISDNEIRAGIVSRRSFICEINAQRHFADSFSNIEIKRYYDDSVALRAGVYKYYISVSYNGKKYELFFNQNGEFLLSDSTFPMARVVYKKTTAHSETKLAYIEELKKLGDSVDKDFLEFVSNPDNISIELENELSVISRVDEALEARHFSPDELIHKGLGMSFVFGSLPKANKFTPQMQELESQLNKVITNEYSPSYKDEYQVQALPELNKSVFEKCINNKPKDEKYDSVKSELVGNASYIKQYSYEIKKNAVDELTYVVGEKRRFVVVTYKGEEFRSELHQNSSTFILKYKLSASAINSEVEKARDTIKYAEEKKLFKGYGWTIGTALIALLAIWQSISFWWLGRYTFIDPGAQTAWMHVGIWVRIVGLIVVGTILIAARDDQNGFKKIKALCEKHQATNALSSEEAEALVNWNTKCSIETVPNDCSRASRFSAFVLAVISTVLFLIPFIISICL